MRVQPGAQNHSITGRAAMKPAATIPTAAVTPAAALSGLLPSVLLGEAGSVDVTVLAGKVSVVVVPDSVPVLVLAEEVSVVVITPLGLLVSVVLLAVPEEVVELTLSQFQLHARKTSTRSLAQLG